MLTGQDIVEGLGPSLRAHRLPAGRCVFPRVVVDSREAGPGDLFVALRGEHHDGHDFIPDAVARGAAGVLASRAVAVPEGVAFFQVPDVLSALQGLARWWRARHDVRVVGITGSVGKTGTKEFVAAVLGQRFRVLKSPGNRNNEIGLPLALLSLTPEHQRAVLEMGMYALGEISALCRMARPAVGVVTSVRPVHLERLGTLDAIARAKQELPQSLPPDGWAVLNGDDALVASMALRTPARVLLYGTGPECDVRGTDVELAGLEAVRFTLHYRGARESVEVRQPGRPGLYGALAAAAVALTEGLPLTEVAALLRAARPEGRLRLVAGVHGSTLLDDTYNASPDSVLAALELLEQAPGRKIAVLGDMLELGSEERRGHETVGRRAAGVVDWLVTVGPRGRIIAEAARAAGLRRVSVCETGDEAERLLRTGIRAGDHVLLKASRGVALDALVARLRAD